jgi:hypothetical protein
MTLDSKMLIVLSIVLVIGSVLGASVATVFADDPFKNIGEIEDDRLPVGVSDKLRIFPLFPSSDDK